MCRSADYHFSRCLLSELSQSTASQIVIAEWIFHQMWQRNSWKLATESDGIIYLIKKRTTAFKLWTRKQMVFVRLEFAVGLCPFITKALRAHYNNQTFYSIFVENAVRKWSLQKLIKFFRRQLNGKFNIFECNTISMLKDWWKSGFGVWPHFDNNLSTAPQNRQFAKIINNKFPFSGSACFFFGANFTILPYSCNSLESKTFCTATENVWKKKTC